MPTTEKSKYPNLIRDLIHARTNDDEDYKPSDVTNQYHLLDCIEYSLELTYVQFSEMILGRPGYRSNYER